MGPDHTWRALLGHRTDMLNKTYGDLCDAEQSGSIRYADLLRLHQFFRLVFREGLETMQREFAGEKYEGWHRPRIPTSINLWMTGPIERALDRMDRQDPRYPIFASFVSEVLATKARVARLTVVPPARRVLRTESNISETAS